VVTDRKKGLEIKEEGGAEKVGEGVRKFNGTKPGSGLNSEESRGKGLG